MATIGEVATRFGLATHVLRHWEDQGLLTPTRDSAGRRIYRDTDIDTIAMVVLGKKAGLSLEDLAALFTRGPDRDTRRHILRTHRDRLTEQLARTRTALDAVTHVLDCDAEDFRTCPHFRAHLATVLDGASSRHATIGP
ncbi:MerR family transcriptional regulator [Nocardia caishijiensis]|uniref:DNA-binding transcriptional MerR regulator n=1 Tax=Nocardia caishijiensis TaxID=184756 RepID=A0ABQ6YMH9_9NOCA|nr:MerR family transcriptional regulator [Nocardia caishijiensis]KAF0846982.1 DNA-binding transcriptional MerR regulator [Nocardia caishijiensis]